MCGEWPWLGRVWAFCWVDSQNSGGVDVLA